ncbi:hypothetical protein COU56_04485 [Candidatus Pacearchaeota archaeon CG10_big_fil_rev_8_21_14_0_10_31_9]|nr:MAG: hypothetical protein AUJ62_00475 [Candidatus Pacearchaeota archaeon CG1_02_32_21]PIN91874.1 MAG: hypothetical protein COU56_04485 [Candidatus Pacearchaeota archaeon CG10_big_fil_rev_8_21_14_0_10_31_9]
MNKKGVSDVISVVLLILLVLAAIGILWYAISGFLNEGTKSVEGSADCLTNSFSIEALSVVGDDLNVSVKKTGGDSAPTRLEFIVAGIKTAQNEVSPSTWPETGEIRVYNLNNVNASAGDEVSVLGVFSTKVCPTADSEIVP